MPEPRQRTARLSCFAVIHDVNGGYMDVRHVADCIRNQPRELVTRVRERLTEDLQTRLDSPVDTGTVVAQEDDLLGELAASEDQATPTLAAELLNVVSSPDDARAVAPILMDVAEELVDEQREAQGQLEPLRKIEKALRTLRSVRITDETRSIDQVAERLSEVVVETDRLTDEVTSQASRTD